MNIYEEVGQNIRKIRLEKGWTQELLSFEAEVNKNYISDLERGARNPTLKILEKIANALGVDIVDLLKEDQAD